MFRNYLKIALRTLRKNIVFSSINIVGLALGMACSILILLWAQDEKEIDAFHVNGDRIFVVYERQDVGGQVSGLYYTPARLPEELKKAIPEIERSCGFADGFAEPERRTFETGNRVFKMEGAPAGEDFFKIFSYRLLYGTPETALSRPDGVAISKKMAEILFGSASNAIAKPVRFENRKDMVVTAVFDDLPAAASDKFDYLINWKAWVNEQPVMQLWDVNFTRTYVQLSPQANPTLVAAKIRHFLDGYNKLLNANFKIDLGLQRFGDVYLHSNFDNGIPSGGRIAYVRLFSGVAVFILLIACINFMNLATATSIKRSREIGIRKVVGALRSVLIVQFTGEAILLAALAMIVALLLVFLCLPAFNSITGKQIAFPLFNLHYLLPLLFLVLLTGLIAGSYPAFFLSSLQPIRVLKGKLRIGTGASWFGKGLVVFQFMLSILLIISTMVVSSQMNYIQKANLGFDRSHLIYIPVEGELVRNYNIFKQEALQLPGVQYVDRISQLPHNMDFSTTLVQWQGKDPNSKVLFVPASVGYDFVRLMNLSVLRGRDFSKAFAADTLNFLINEVAAKKMGFSDPIGKKVSIFGKEGEIIGVLKDFHFNSLREEIQPLLLDVNESVEFGSILVRTQPGMERPALDGLERVYRQYNQKFPFTFSFADEEYQKLYKNEQMTSRLSGVFAALAISISCLGLLGLSAFSAEQRFREIGIRKVLGASVTDIIILFSLDFIRLLGISFVIGGLAAWLAMHKWLEGFAYRIHLSWWIFALAGVFAVLIMLLTIASQVFKAALVPPVKTLRSE